MKNRLFDLSISFLYPLIDFIIVSFSILASYKIYRVLEIGRYVFYFKMDIIPASFIIASVAVIIMTFVGAYTRESSLLNVEEIKNSVKGLTVSFLFIMVVLVFGKVALSRYVLLFSYIISIIFVTFGKSLLYHILPNIKSVKGLSRRILIYGCGELGQNLFRAIENSPKLGIVPVGFIDDDPNKCGTVCRSSGFSRTFRTLRVLGTREDIIKLKIQYKIDEAIIAISDMDREDIIEIINYIKNLNIKVSFVPNLYKLFVHRVKIDQIGQIPVVSEFEGYARYYPYLKRFVDILIASFLIIVFSPLFLVIALWIKNDSKGPVFFKQDRVGKEGELFKIFKFRSMTVESDPYAVNPHNTSDSRVTKVGRFLRKTSLDELPQLINVLKGEMSVVGPRPEMKFIVDGYTEIHRERLKVLPGITGLWQLSGDRELAIHENMDYDLYYIRNMSFFLDLAILLETLIFAFKGV